MNSRFKTLFLLILITFVLILGIYLYTYFCNNLKNTTSNLLTEQEAVKIAMEELERLGHSNKVIVKAELNELNGQSFWYLWTTNNELYIKINAISGKLVCFSNVSLDDADITSTYDKTLAQSVAKQLYLSLGYTENEYQIEDLKMNIANSSLWQADFCKKYDGIYNPYECIRLIFIPETNMLKSLVIFDYKLEDNPVILTEDQSIEIAKSIDNNNKSTLKEVVSTFGFAKTNKLTSRKSWIVELHYNSSFVDIHYYYIDATTGVPLLSGITQ